MSSKTGREYKVILCVPSGRRQYLEILLPYLLRDRGVINEVHLWLNTRIEADLQYIKSVSSRHPDFIKCIEMPNMERNGNLVGHIAGVCQFYANCIDADAIYIKCDDDICFIENGAIADLVAFREQHQEPFLIYPNIVNNVVISHLHQRFGGVPRTVGICQWHPFCEIGHKSGAAAQVIHDSFISEYERDSLDTFKFSRYILWDYIRVSIGFMLFFGHDFAEFGGLIEGYDDEHFLASVLPERMKRPNVIYGGKLVCHFSYRTQQEYLESNTTLLSKYKAIMLKETAISGRLT